jgi:Kef-type K+ transport system membrane component KefB
MFDLIDVLNHVKPQYMLLIQACIVILIPFLLWRTLGLSRWIPLGVIQIVAGVLLGPAIFGALFPDLFKSLFGVVEFLKDGKPVKYIRNEGIGAVANIAVCLFGFLAGADADKKVIANSGPSVASIGVVGMLLGWAIASFIGYFVYSWLPQSHFPDTSHFGFTLAFGLVVAVSALPVLALILRDLDFTRKRIGAVALASAGIADSLMWLGLAIVVAVSVIGGSIAKALMVAALGGILSYGFVRFVAYPILERLFDQKAPEAAIITICALAIFVASAITGITELHPVLGAFVAGLFLPDRARELAAHRFDQTTVLVLMPFFFLFSGLRTNFSFGDPNIWILFGITIFLCIFGKAVAHALAAKLTGENWPFSATVGLLLQSKGLMGLIVCNVFYDKQIVSPLMFSAAVLMCIASTILPTPILRAAERKYGKRLTQGDKADEPVEIISPPANSKPVLARLEFEGDRDPISITQSSSVLGRHTTDDIRIDDVRMSRSHILLTIEKDGRARLKNQTADRAEPNPVTVNGVYQEDAEIKDGDKITVGGFGFTYREALDAAARRVAPA